MSSLNYFHRRITGPRRAVCLVTASLATCSLFATAFMRLRSQTVCEVGTLNLPHRLTVSLEFPEKAILLCLESNAGSGVNQSGWSRAAPRDVQIFPSSVIDTWSLKGLQWNGAVYVTVNCRLISIDYRVVLVLSALLQIGSLLGWVRLWKRECTVL
jgi:hypothetical protein